MPTAIRHESSPSPSPETETRTRTRHELSPQTRARICKLRSYNLSYREIFAVFPEIPLSTIRSTILKEPAREGNKSLPRAGRPRTLTPEQRDHIYDLLAHREPTIKMRDLLEEVDHAIKPRAMRLLLREMGFPRPPSPSLLQTSNSNLASTPSFSQPSNTNPATAHHDKEIYQATHEPNHPLSPLLHPRLPNPPSPLPRLIVFDLDYTLWPFWVDTHPLPPFRPSADHTSASDRAGETYAFYPDSPAILLALTAHLSVKVAAASRTHAPDRARELLKMLWVYTPEDAGGVQKKEKPRKAIDFFDAGMEIYPGSKMGHFENLRKKTGVEFTDMLFFDDESRNAEVESLGVTMWLVKDGMSWDELENGVGEWRKRRGHA